MAILGVINVKFQGLVVHMHVQNTLHMGLQLLDPSDHRNQLRTQVRSMVDEGALGFGFHESWEFELLGNSWPDSTTMIPQIITQNRSKSHDRRQIPRSADPQEKKRESLERR